jgi:DNA-binding YbaB/EbfC family protein
MFGDMMGKLQEMKQKTEETKKRLDTISVDAEVENGLVKVVCNGNRKITSITISDELIKEGDKEQIEELTSLAINRALEKAEKVAEAEMVGVAKGMIPGFM